MNSSVKSWTRSLIASACLFVVACVGCSRGGNVPVDKNAARNACETFLNAWQEGKKPEDLKPKIIGSDYIWASGKQLVAFEILPNETNDGTNVHFPARLTLKNEKGVEVKSNVSYAVGTSPVVTVIRDFE